MTVLLFYSFRRCFEFEIFVMMKYQGRTLSNMAFNIFEKKGAHY